MNDNEIQEKLNESEREIKQYLFAMLHMKCDCLDYFTDGERLYEEQPLLYCDNGLPCELPTCKHIDMWFRKFHKFTTSVVDAFSFWGVRSVKKREGEDFEFRLEDLIVVFKEKL